MSKPQRELQASDDAVLPSVSVIIPAYNAVRYVRDALDSVLAQTFSSREIIVVNDGSPDSIELETALERYQQRIVYIRQENRGLSGARNTGIRAARGSLVAFLDADDVWEPDYLETHVAALNSDPTLDVIYSDAVIFGNSVFRGRRLMEFSPSEGEVTFENLVTLRCNVMVSVTARRATIVRAGLFDEAFRGAGDFDLWLRIVKAGGRIGYHRRPLVRYRRRADSLSANSVQMYQESLLILRKARRDLHLTPAENAALEQGRSLFHATLRFHEGKKAFRSGDFSAAAVALAEANEFFRSRKLALVNLLLRFTPQPLLKAYELRERLRRRSDEDEGRLAGMTRLPQRHPETI